MTSPIFLKITFSKFFFFLFAVMNFLSDRQARIKNMRPECGALTYSHAPVCGVITGLNQSDLQGNSRLKNTSSMQQVGWVLEI